MSLRRNHEPEGHISWLEHTIGGIAGSIERAVFTEEHARKDGWLQKRDPRAKLLMFVLVVLAAGLSNSLAVLIGLYVAVLVAAWASKVPFDFFVKRVWLGIPFFAGVVIVPSIFFAGPPHLFDVALGSLHIAVSEPGLMGAAVFIARVGVSVSLAVLLVLTTPWADLIKSLQALRVPQVFTLLLAMTYRYIFLFLHSANGMLEARKSRSVGRPSGADSRRWISAAMMSQLNRSFKMSSDVYAAMLSRGFSGTVRTYSSYQMTSADYMALGAAVALATLAFVAGRLLA